jgi:hypothetical protein
VLPEFEAVTLRVAECRDSIRHKGIRFAKLNHESAVFFNLRLHLLDQFARDAPIANTMTR